MMRPGAHEPPLRGIVEVDDLTDGGNPARRNRARYGSAMAKHIYNPPGRGFAKDRLLVAVERGGRARASAIRDGTRAAVEPVLRSAVSPAAHLMTDGDRTLAIGKDQAAHDAVGHSDGEYVRGNAHVNTAEAFNLFIRRAKMGVWHIWSEKHRQRYLDELQFRWALRPNNHILTNRAHRTLYERPVIERMRGLFANARGRELRRTENGGIREPSPVLGASPIDKQGCVAARTDDSNDPATPV